MVGGDPWWCVVCSRGGGVVVCFVCVRGFLAAEVPSKRSVSAASTQQHASSFSSVEARHSYSRDGSFVFIVGEVSVFPCCHFFLFHLKGRPKGRPNIETRFKHDRDGLVK